MGRPYGKGCSTESSSDSEEWSSIRLSSESELWSGDGASGFPDADVLAQDVDVRFLFGEGDD